MMTDTTIPTAEGLRRWPHTEGYYPDLSASGSAPDRELPCTCTGSCAARCAGECGCKACGFAFAEFCDTAGLLGVTGLQVSERDALIRYRGE